MTCSTTHCLADRGAAGHSLQLLHVSVGGLRSVPSLQLESERRQARLSCRDETSPGFIVQSNLLLAFDPLDMRES